MSLNVAFNGLSVRPEQIGQQTVRTKYWTKNSNIIWNENCQILRHFWNRRYSLTLLLYCPLTPPHVRANPKPGMLTSYVVQWVEVRGDVLLW
jgi:hypothetical protein